MARVSQQSLQQAAQQGIISPQQATQLLEFLEQQEADTPSFNLTHLLYYFGGLIAIGAMTLFMNLAWEGFGGWGLLGISIVYAVLGLMLCQRFKHQGYAIPAGICATFVICLTPLATYGFQHAMGWWPSSDQYQDYHRYVHWHWIYMELATLVVGLILSWRYRYPFMLLPVAVTLWYMSMDICAMLTGSRPNWEFRSLVSLYFGLAMTLLAFWIDICSRHSKDFAFWIYLFGVLTFWCGLSLQHSDSELAKLAYFSINLAMMLCGVILARRVFVVFGAFGCFAYFYHLADNVFQDSWLFPISLTLVGLAIIYLGILWQKHQQRLSRQLRSYLPNALQELLANKLH
ncbi:hypothetical protein AHAT_05910 [Agarivorans sp. Toyoura001]|uniref:DUF2157 domain-containing protein n=1 Tax=Agarivorans sp. Toyoura001 TaxID=2283141 RepID=UPI0010D61460|nr:DUF2157 domain-containing protein [Agarivorans sp. Toyoura001]GDY24701.1 hypothetical protein AHAT_05910 [Agarivorans sp. Toyoura001]